jgi:hypothetical protein
MLLSYSIAYTLTLPLFNVQVVGITSIILPDKYQYQISVYHFNLFRRLQHLNIINEGKEPTALEAVPARIALTTLGP